MIIKKTKEIWKTIKSYPEYKISNRGRIKSFKSKNSRILKTKTNKWGYHQVGLYLNNKNYSATIHLLVIDHFGPPKPSPLHECNHIDGNQDNN